jgi:hypothetical protein
MLRELKALPDAIGSIKFVSYPAQLRRSGTKRLLPSMPLPTKLGLLDCLKPYKRAAPNGASLLGPIFSTKLDGL